MRDLTDYTAIEYAQAIVDLSGLAGPEDVDSVGGSGWEGYDLPVIHDPDTGLDLQARIAWEDTGIEAVTIYIFGSGEFELARASFRTVDAAVVATALRGMLHQMSPDEVAL